MKKLTKKEEMELVAITNFSIEHEETLKHLFAKFRKDTNDTETPYFAFVILMYQEGREIIDKHIKPSIKTTQVEFGFSMN